MSDIKGLLKQAKRRQITEPVCLRGDLAGEHEQLLRELAGLPEQAAKLGGDPERRRIEAELERLRAQMQDGTVDFVLRALPPAAFQRLVDEHPPRRDGDQVNERDAEFGFNRVTFFPALFRACTVEPVLDDDDWSVLFAEALSVGQVTNLGLAAYRINGEAVDVPFSPAASNVSPG